MNRLNPSQNEFLSTLQTASFSNPFGDTRRRIDLEMTGALSSWPRQRIREAQQKRVQEELKKIIRGGKKIGSFQTQDQAKLRDGLSFMLFHSHAGSFTSLIESQTGGGAASTLLPNAKDLIEEMESYGFPKKEIPQYIAWFFQLHRAFYFIDRDLQGQSPCMHRFREALWNNVFTYQMDRFGKWLWNRMEDFSTILLGETGTGKGQAAAAIGRSAFIPFDRTTLSFKANFVEAFTDINLSQYPETLLESELFGHRKGAFTGAVEHHEGIFERSSVYGAVFLDEIGEIDIPVQIKLLRVLQERRFCSVGSHQDKRFDGRVIAATHQPLDRLREQGRFRDDFYYRLCSDRINVPTLRQRIQEDRGELKLLIDSISTRILGEASPEVAKDLHERILKQIGPNYAWPGNVRELEQCIRRILICGRYQATPLPSPVTQNLAGQLQQGKLTAKQLLAHYCNQLYQQHRSYEEIARRIELDRRTVKKYVEEANASST